MSRYRWLEPAPAPSSAFDLTDFPLLSVILARRGITSLQQARSFLQPRVHELADPYGLPDLELAAERVRSAIRNRRPIAVFGDYDVDGLTSTALLTRVLRSLGAEVRPYVPNRLQDGYGLNLAAIDRIIKDGAALLLTADCGTSNGRELAMAQRAGLETVVLDHHHAHGVELPGTAFVSPRREDCRYPFREMSAVGVCYHLVRALAGEDVAAAMLPLVALGTVADVVPLVGENRIKVHHGLARFGSDAPLGLKELARQADLDPFGVTSWHCGFILGPRINAAGRMADPLTALDLLLTDDPAKASRLALELGKLNARRQREMERMIAEAEEKLRHGGRDAGPLLVLADTAWSIGLVGLVAGRLVERYRRPAIVLERGPDVSRGSARSIDGFNIAEALGQCHDLLLEHGGHSMAAGLTIETERLVELEERLVGILDATVGDDIPTPTLQLDAELHSSELTLETERLVSLLEPTGHGNAAPRFFARGLAVRRPRVSRDGKHLMFQAVGSDGTAVRAVFFNGAYALPDLVRLGRVDLAFSLKRDSWKGETRVELDVLDFRPATEF
ncbi:Single-stranded-DNA-specific exonuclease RecJ [Nitrolancea hollandica Lb]|uniref:Single-stranded-DNA-specific exonuclease RecJ n=2 Tax=Nitrolancea hollandica TaxID=1206749 RepID=I4EDB2_9BACT|nr:Single-stranded-DNA-specific exonuclease RecJ [Nitrolancea hollandica Lb]